MSTTVLSMNPADVPKQGILLNPSPSLCPHRSTYLLSSQDPSDSSLSSSVSSSHLNTPPTELWSGNAVPHKRYSRSPRVSHHEHKPRSGSTPNSRRIRFAPLPDPRRDEYLTDGEDITLPPVFLDDAQDAQPRGNSAQPSNDNSQPHDAAPAAGSLLLSPESGLRIQTAGSSLALGSTASISGNASVPSASNSGSSDPDSSEQSSPATASPLAGSMNLPDDISRRNNSKKWSRILKPLFAPLSRSANSSTDDLRSTTSVAGLNGSNLTLTSPQAVCGDSVEGCSIGLGAGSRCEKTKKKREKPEPEWVRDFGMPLYRWSSEGDPVNIPLNQQGRSMSISELREAGPDIWKKQEASKKRPKGGNGTRMLNGRVYGAKRNGGNLFANVRSEEPEFVEWGYGGMGSVQANSVGAGVWAKVQTSRGLSIGAHEHHHGTPKRPGTASSEMGTGPTGDRDDDDDGSGMAWVRRRREQKEREQRERSQQQQYGAKDGGKTKADAESAESPPSGKTATAVAFPVSASNSTSSGESSVASSS